MVDSAREPTGARILVAERDYSGRQLLGAREGQEDAYGVVPPEELGEGRNDLLVLVADGMGGHAAGEVASALAVERVAARFVADAGTGESDMARLWDALEEANDAIGEKIRESGGSFEGMGTTLVALLIRGKVAHWISVGDSSLYLVRDGQASLLNEMHIWAKKLDEEAREGLITEEEALNDEKRHRLMSALVGERLFEVDDSDPLILEPGDILLAATDGLETLALEELEGLVNDAKSQPVGELVDAIMEEVRMKGRPNQDNVTLVAVRMPEGSDQAEPECDDVTAKS